MAWRRICGLIVVCSLAVASALLIGRPTTAHAAPAGRVWSVQLTWDDNGQPWSEQTFASLRAQGVNHAEINLEWSQIEPSPGTFDFAEIDTVEANAASAGIQLVPIFWQSVWGGNPASWITDYEVTSTGARAQLPAWWDASEQQAYFTYVTTTIAHLQARPGYGGAFLDLGWLDAMWGPAPSGISGYASADVAKFHSWLPGQYGTVGQFNKAYGTAYTSFDQVPAATPGQALFPVYQAFRLWTVTDTYDRLTAQVRQESSGPLYYYWGGDFPNAQAYGNLPDIFFGLARRYGVTVVLDDAESPGLAVTFGSLARAYHVPLLQEWTPQSTGLAAEAAQWLGHYGLGEPQATGEDFFIYQGGADYNVGFPIYTSWIPRMEALRGTYPEQPVALYLSFAGARGTASMAGLTSASSTIGATWQRTQMGFTVVTDTEVADHVVNLSQFRAVLPVDGTDAAISAYAAKGGHVLTSAAQLTQYATPYAQLTPDVGMVETVPTVAPGGGSASISVAEVDPLFAYSGSVTFLTAGLGLRDGTYHLVDQATGAAPAQLAVAGGVCAPLQLSIGAFSMWNLVPGAAPPGTPVATGCGSPGSSGATTVTAVAGQAAQGLAFLNVGGDGNLNLITQGGESAEATWTTAQSNTGGDYAYLLADPSSQVSQASTITVDVTYWTSPGQGFQMQYDGAQGAYEAGPTFQSPGTNQWTTAQFTIQDAAFDQGQNGGADFRLFALDGTQPLIIHQVTLTTP